MKTAQKAPKHTDRSWGIGIAIFYVAFVLITLGLVFFATLQRFDLVADNYYEDGVKYQEKLDRMALASNEEYKLDIKYQKSSRELKLTFPATVSSDSITGNIVLFRPSNASLDRRWEIDPGNDGVQSLDLNQMRRGVWKAMVYWKAGNIDLYTEQSIFVE